MCLIFVLFSNTFKVVALLEIQQATTDTTLNRLEIGQKGTK